MSKTIKMKKQKIIGTETYINQKTGEIIECSVIQKEVSQDFNFHKVWIEDLITILTNIGGKKLKVLNYLIENMRDSDNTISITYDKMEEQLKISRKTIAETMKILQENDFIKKIQNGLYMVNPDVLVKGKTTKRHHLLIRYKKVGES